MPGKVPPPRRVAKPLVGNAPAVAKGALKLRGTGGRGPEVTSRSYGLRQRNNGKAAARDTSWPAGNVRRVVVRKQDPERSKASSSSSASSEVEAVANVDEPRDSPSVAGETDGLHGAVPKAVAKETPKPSDQHEQDGERVAEPAETGALLPERPTLPTEAESESEAEADAEAGIRAGAMVGAKVDSEGEETRLVSTADPAAEALPGISESWTREMRWEGLTLRLFRAHPDRWYIAFRPQLRAFLPKGADRQGGQLRRAGRLPLVVLDELRRLDRERPRYTGVAAEDFARELATDALRRSWEAALAPLQQGVPPPEAGRLEPRPPEPAGRAGAGVLVAAPPAREAEAAEGQPGARRSARLRERRRLGREEARAAEALGAPAPREGAAAGARGCYPCLLAGVPCHGRISYRGVRLACSFCRAAGLSQRQCALPPKAYSWAPKRAAKCHYCRDPCTALPYSESRLDPNKTCAACGLLVCGRAGCRRAARVQEHLPYYVCCHCLGVPQECGCPDGQSLLRRLLLRGPLSTRAPIRLQRHGEHLAPMVPAVCQRLPREMHWLFLSASRRPWLRMEHRHFVFELRRLRAQVEKLRGRDDGAVQLVLDRWRRPVIWPAQVLAKHLVALKGGPPPPALSDQSLGWCPWPPQRKRPFRARLRRPRAKARRGSASEEDPSSLSSSSSSGSSSSSEGEARGGSSSSSSSSGPTPSPSRAADSD